ncbi:hypothetical protein EMIHUDRAFT_122162 [Emiliania huxleyi CCMP1516]|uniref:Uncharacterized protein n=2 Tax=Emiliania huxleyi TaxID=2903 RepID=A0A0D3KSU9_EMIH1|nr:hypothetical protein EMIHUDRAFT_122162 [Emiliania huxleyi CCMP1516]EOD38834.1 hypothetical protein EMIHUDRAFT_122162 [Emiliania huxleyi CCMP1516]|eukprot:XP_005791263.1 hypothetical protein EMIHUDRAFT_122162 [Emiliania huxleyi CCMP1516]
MGLFGSDSPSKKEETAPLVTPEKEGLRQRRKSPFTKADEEKKDKIDQLVLAASDKVSPQARLGASAALMHPYRRRPQAIATIAPFYIMAAKKLYEIGNKLPWDILQAVIGLGLCFFGGGYCASIAAAFALTGWPTTRQALIDVYEEAANVLDANEEDDKKDEDKNGAFGYSVAALGFYIQWSWGFGLPFPLSLVMLPFDILEWYIRWSISSGGE